MIAWAICRRDLIAAFTTPLAWLVIACWSLVTNLLFALTIDGAQGTAGADEPLYALALRASTLLALFLAPALTMNSFAGERAQGTMQLLLTVPVRESALVLGKFLASFAVLASLILVALVQPLALAFISDVDWPQAAAGYGGLLLCCAFYAALGAWVSLVVDSAVAAYVITFAALFVLTLVGWGDEGSALAAVGDAIGLPARSAGFFTGVVRLGDVAYFVAGTALFLVLAHAALRARRING